MDLLVARNNLVKQIVGSQPDGLSISIDKMIELLVVLDSEVELFTRCTWGAA